MSGFKKFILRGNVVDLAVAVVIGAAFIAVIQAVVKGLITPLIGVLGGVPDFSGLVIEAGASRFLVGDVVNAIISLLVIALVVYFLVVVPVNRLMDRMKPEAPPAVKTRECPYCLSKVPERATRCAFCTSELNPSTSTVAA